LSRAAGILAGHEVTLDVAAGLPMLNLDVVLFEQVLFNLLDNAAKYAPAGSRIQIRAYRDGDQVVLQVIDEGEGIPPQDVERIFEKFYRANGAAIGAADGTARGAARGADNQRAGTGLGLAISRGFIEAMGGTISAANRTDRSGAIITIALPVPVGAPLVEETTS
jgi:two-component system, OmpR family, sensor histidine kinase KdpD